MPLYKILYWDTLMMSAQAQTRDKLVASWHSKISDAGRSSRHTFIPNWQWILDSGGIYRGADKSLGRPGKQANVSVRMAWIFFGALPCRGGKSWWQLASRCWWNHERPWHASELLSFLVGLRTYQHLGSMTGWVNFLRRLALQEKKNLDDSSHLDVVEITRVPDMLPSLFPSW